MRLNSVYELRDMGKLVYYGMCYSDRLEERIFEHRDVDNLRFNSYTELYSGLSRQKAKEIEQHLLEKYRVMSGGKLPYYNSTMQRFR